MSKPAVFFDRDGVINIDTGFVGQIERFDFIDGVKESLSLLKEKGYYLVLVTNQSGIARGKYTEDDFHTLSNFMQKELGDSAVFDKIYFCPHHPNAPLEQYKQECSCRKPNSGMFLKAISELDIDVDNSIMIGDHASDLVAAQKANIKTNVLVGNHIESEKELVSNILIFKSLKDFVTNYKGFIK